MKDAVAVKSSDEKVPIDILVKRHGGATYIFAVSMRDVLSKASFEVKGLGEKSAVEMLIGGEGTIELGGAKFEDSFGGYEVKVYRIRRADRRESDSRQKL